MPGTTRANGFWSQIGRGGKELVVGNFRALVLHEEGGKVVSRLETVDEARLPPGEVTVAVEYSTLNYKDGMILEGQGRLVRAYPHVPGVDFAGTVLRSDSPEFRPGDPVILTGWRVGEVQWGGYAERARVKAAYLVRRPDGLSARQAMAIGTAGFTAMLAVIALERHGLTPDAGEVLVTGAAGGVGSVAVSLLSALGYRVAASTGRPELRDYLEGLGAAELIDRAALAAKPARPLDRERWAGAVDAVGGATLATVLTQLKYRGSVAACGLAGGSDLPASVIPFLLRGVNLLGIDSVMCPRDERIEAWDRLARDLPFDKLEAATQTVPLAEVPALAPRILKGEVRGRVVIDIDIAA
jgi:acrylyl-CoA reductase (NADPH)